MIVRSDTWSFYCTYGIDFFFGTVSVCQSHTITTPKAVYGWTKTLVHMFLLMKKVYTTNGLCLASMIGGSPPTSWTCAHSDAEGSKVKPLKQIHSFSCQEKSAIATFTSSSAFFFFRASINRTFRWSFALFLPYLPSSHSIQYEVHCCYLSCSRCPYCCCSSTEHMFLWSFRLLLLGWLWYVPDNEMYPYALFLPYWHPFLFFSNSQEHQ